MGENKKNSYFDALIKYGKIVVIIIVILFVSFYCLVIITQMSLDFGSHKNNKTNSISAVENNNNVDNEVDESTVDKSKDSSLFIHGEEVDINSDLIQNLYHRVSNDYDTPVCGFGVNGDNSSFFSGYANEKSRMFYVGIYLSNSNSRKTIDVSSIPKMGDNRPGYSVDVDNIVGYYYTRKQVEDAYHTLYGVNADFNNSNEFFPDTFIGPDKAELNCFIYDKNTDLYYSYNGDGGLVCQNKNLHTTKLSKSLQNNDYIIIYQDVNVYDNNNVSDSFQYIYVFKKDSNGEYVFISKVKQ